MTLHVTYAHKDAPDGNRFLALATDKVPEWAVDVQPSEQLNWAGLPQHPTDEYFHWKDNNQNGEMTKLREVYDELVNMVGVEKVKLLMDKAYSAGRLDESDANNPDM